MERGLPKTRIRLYLDTYGMNKGIQSDIDEVDKKILELKKLNGTVKPVNVKKSDYTKKNEGSNTKSFKSSAHEKQYTDALESYKKEFDVWNNYVSKEFMIAKSAHKCVLLLERFKQLLEIGGDKYKEELTEIANTLKSVSPKELLVKKYPKETTEDFETRKKAVVWHPASFSEFIKEKQPIGLGNIDKIIADIKTTHKDVDLFLNKRSYARDKERFSDEGVTIITKTVEDIMKELIALSISNARADGSKKVLPEHIVSDESNLFYTFYELLPQYRLIQERTQRKLEYEKECVVLKNTEVKKLMDECKRQNRDFNVRTDLPKFENIKSFEESEVSNGFAVKTEKENKNGQKRVSYKWKGIDTWDESCESSFVIYSKGYFDDLLKDCEIDFSSESTSCLLKVSSSTHMVINNVVIEFLNYLLPRLTDLKKLFGDKKTTDGKMVLFVIKNILSQRVIDLTPTQRHVYSELEKLMAAPKKIKTT